jgi:hypothetical protein
MDEGGSLAGLLPETSSNPCPTKVMQAKLVMVTVLTQLIDSAIAAILLRPLAPRVWRLIGWFQSRRPSLRLT